MQTFTHIKNLINNKAFDEAEIEINKIYNSAKSPMVLAKCYFWLGEIYKSF